MVLKWYLPYIIMQKNDCEIPHIDKSPYNNAAPPSTSAITSLSAVPFAASADAATSKHLAIAFPL